MTRRQQASAGELSSASKLLQNMRLPGGKYPGQHVIREVRKGKGKIRYAITYGGKIKRFTSRQIAEMARDRGFDLSNQRYQAAPEAVKADMLAKSLHWQKRSKVRWAKRMQERIDTVTDPRKKAQLQAQLKKFKRSPVHSPHTGKAPVSAHLKRYFA